MRIAVISDIHGNIEAFDRVLADIDAHAVERIVSLGDNVGYGPDPEGVMGRIRERGIVSVLGNHEYALVYPNRRNWFNAKAREALAITENLLSDASKSLIATFPRKIEEPAYYFVHGYPPESVHTYLFVKEDEDVRAAFDRFPAGMFFVGHTHLLALVTSRRGVCSRRDIWKGAMKLDPGDRHMVNVGSVGQPRDHDPHAKYVIWDEASRTLDVRFVEYDVEKTARDIIARGIPETYAQRLTR